MYKEKNEMIRNYVSKVSMKPFLSLERNRDMFNEILEDFRGTYDYEYQSKNKRQYNLDNILWTKSTKRISNIFSGSEHEVLVALQGMEWADKFKKIWDRSSDYIYSSGSCRRSFRTKTNEVIYLNSAIWKLNSMIFLVANDFTFEKYFSQKDNTYAYNPVIPDLIALELDEGNGEVADKIREIIYGDNNVGIINREIIKGILMSRNSEAHKWIGELLIAAKLQEGLRQTIVECMDEGSKEGFLYMLKIIIDNDLLRFSSVVRALDVWTGLCISAQKPTAVKKCLEIGYKCLTETGYSNQCINDDDAMRIYMGLWSIAFDEIMDTEKELKKLLTADKKYKKLAALFFLKQTKFPLYEHGLSVKLLDEPDYEIKAWVMDNLFNDEDFCSMWFESDILSAFKDKFAKYNGIQGACSLNELFYKLKDTLDDMPKKEMVFKESLFPWWQATISYNEVIRKMLYSLVGDVSDDKIDTMLDYKDKMSAETRAEFIRLFLNNPKTNRQKTGIVEFLGDKSSYVRTCAMKIVDKQNLSEEDYKIVEDMLRYKSGDLRKNAISILLKQSPLMLLESIKRLNVSGDENKLLAELDIISSIENNPKYEDIVNECRQIAAANADTSQKTRLLAQNITEKSANNYTAANGFGLFDVKNEIQLPEFNYQKGFTSKEVFSSDISDIKNILNYFSELIEEHKDYEYEIEDWFGEHKKVVLGGEYDIRRITNVRDIQPRIHDYPLAEVWKEAAEKCGLTSKMLLELLFCFSFERTPSYVKVKDWYREIMSELFPIKNDEFEKGLKRLKYSNHVYSILRALLSEYSREEVFLLSKNMCQFIYKKVPMEYFSEDYQVRDKRYYIGYNSYLVDSAPVLFWLSNMRSNVSDDKDFTEYFKTAYAFYKASEYKAHSSLCLEDFARAWTLNLVDENELYAELCGRRLSPDNLRILTSLESHEHKSVSQSNKLKEIYNHVIDRVLCIELKRGDMNTEVSHLASVIQKCEGTRFFVDILIGAEKDTYVRGYNFLSGDSTKKQIFSHILKCCYPAKGEDQNTLRELLKNKKVSDKQLIDAAMYSPQWIDIVEKYLAWPGLKSACWYFHAHVNEAFSNKKETIVAIFSPVSPKDFMDGAFDMVWFNEAYSTLGEKRFKVVYDSAKYIAGGSLHKRAQLFADAALGKIEVKQAEKVISEKRNKDYVLVYGLIPIGNDKKDMLHRFEFLQGFLKESKQFGAQRRESESKAVAISLKNLARNAGFPDVTRFTWYMETEKIQSIEHYLKPAVVGDVQLFINIDEDGKATINVMKDGKTLKDIPSKLKENEYVKGIKVVQRSLKDQYTRARKTLEKSMESSDEFTVDELLNLSLNPVISPLIKNLVFKCGDNLGYFKDTILSGPKGKTIKLQPENKCIIAHPVHLFESGEWSMYQKDIYDRKIVQPFKQVFRELYRPNSDELESRTVSRRYAGYQIQPQKAAALLKSRGWTANYEEGLQKVYYKENIIAQIYAMADWFTPSDVEAPTIEGVEFFDRKSGKSIPFEGVSKVVFSEIMRDVDLVVSVAHVGGVDPEASLSTVEMRTVIVAEMLRLLKFENVELKGSHAFIKGSLGEYTVHLGSGVVHKMASGALQILPVHSQHRGRIFLPFIDDDPRTAEIISKIVLLAEDNKIKDPTVLIQIK